MAETTSLELLVAVPGSESPEDRVSDSFVAANIPLFLLSSIRPFLFPRLESFLFSSFRTFLDPPSANRHSEIGKPSAMSCKPSAVSILPVLTPLGAGVNCPITVTQPEIFDSRMPI